MAVKNRTNQRKHLKSGGSYSCEELRFLTMEDGARVVYSADGDIKRPACAGIDVHKKLLMAAVCKTDKEALKAVFYVRKFTTRNRDVRSITICHMIRDDADFLPVDHEDIIQNTKKTKGLNLKNVIAFLKEQGADESTLENIPATPIIFLLYFFSY